MQPYIVSNERNKESGAESLLRAKHSNTDTSFRLFYNQIDDGTNKTRKATRIHFCKQTTQTPAHLACSATRSTMERTKQGKQRGFTLASKPLKAPTHLVCSKPHKSSAVSSTPQLSLTVKKHSQTPRSWNRTFLQANLIHLRHAWNQPDFVRFSPSENQETSRWSYSKGSCKSMENLKGPERTDGTLKGLNPILSRVISIIPSFVSTVTPCSTKTPQERFAR